MQGTPCSYLLGYILPSPYRPSHHPASHPHSLIPLQRARTHSHSVDTAGASCPTPTLTPPPTLRATALATAQLSGRPPAAASSTSGTVGQTDSATAPHRRSACKRRPAAAAAAARCPEGALSRQTAHKPPARRLAASSWNGPRRGLGRVPLQAAQRTSSEPQTRPSPRAQARPSPCSALIIAAFPAQNSRI